MPFKDILFGAYAPDRGGFPFPRDPGYLVQANNVRPTSQGYRPSWIDETVASTATLAATLNAGIGASLGAGVARHYVSTDTNLYESADAGVTWNTNSRGAGYTASSNWDFCFFNGYVIAVNGVDEPQVKSISAAVTDDFADLAGTPPVAYYASRIRDHLVLGRLDTNAYSIQWSAIGNHESWPTPGTASALAAQAGSKTFPYEYGPVLQIVSGEKFGLVFQMNGIHRMTYVGGNVVYEFDDLEANLGIEQAAGNTQKKSAIMVGGWCYFAASAGFFRTDGFVVENISIGKIQDALVRDFLSLTEASGVPGSGGVVYDPIQNTVIWSSGAAYLVCYHISFGEFSIISRATTQDTYGIIYRLRDITGSYDVSSLIFGWNSTPKLISYTDQTAVPTTVRTGYFELVDGYATITGLEPLGKGSSLTLASKSVAAMSSISLSSSGYTNASAPTRSHLYRIRQSGRYHSLQVTDTGDADDVYQGVRVHYERASGL